MEIILKFIVIEFLDTFQYYRINQSRSHSNIFKQKIINTL